MGVQWHNHTLTADLVRRMRWIAAYIAAYTAQQQQLAPTLHTLNLWRAWGGLLDFDALRALHGLRELHLKEVLLDPADLVALSSMTSVTRLKLRGYRRPTEAACSMTGLRELYLTCGKLEQPTLDPLPSAAAACRSSHVCSWCALATWMHHCSW
jgi:hypothetical protein